MLAVDTNVIVRYLVRDDGAQAARANRLVRAEQILLLKTVLLESEWVLRSGYAFDRNAIVSSLRGLMGLPTVHVEDEIVVAQALNWFAAGMDFADAMHLAGGATTGQFVTFDRRLAASARRIKAMDVLLLT